MEKIMILLPEVTDILKNRKSFDICYDHEEYSIYFKNIIYPYSDQYDVVVDCAYGSNYGNCWRIKDFPDDVTEFELKIHVYAPYGRLLASASTRVVLHEKTPRDTISLMCIGDSMTRAEMYINHAVNKAENVITLGTRRIKHPVYHEGRGGWRLSEYFERFEDTGKGVSPFLFPKGYSGESYFGDMEFARRLKDDSSKNGYYYYGSPVEEIKDGMYFTEKGKLYQYKAGECTQVCDNPEYEFDFGKYLKRNSIPVPDVVSILTGANDLQECNYQNVHENVGKFISDYHKIINEIKKTSDLIKIVINMPVTGAQQYAWGMQTGCKATSKCFEYAIKLACERLLDDFDGKRDQNIYLCPMLAVCDPYVGFDNEYVNANIYSKEKLVYQCNWVHPNESGYRQMGDALAGVLTAISDIN